MFREFARRCREAGITVPIIPGLKVLTSKKQLRSIPSNFYCDIPTELADEAEAAEGRKEVVQVGVEWAARQAEELIEKGAPSIHFYVMQNAGAVARVMERLAAKDLAPPVRQG